MARKFKGVLTPATARNMSASELRKAFKAGWVPPIAGGALESNINSLWAAKQSGRGFPVVMTAGTKRFRWVGGDINTARADGTEPFSDGTLFGDTVDFVNTMNGNGAPVVMGQSGSVAYLSWLAGGQETVTGGVSAVHTLTSTATGGTFKLNFNGFITAAIAWNATAAVIQAAILAAVNSQGVVFSSGGSVVCAGGPLPTAVTITYATGFATQPVPIPTVDNTLATGGVITAASTTIGTGFQHVATPSNVGGFYSTWVKSVGASVVYRGQFNDARIASLRYEGSSASKVLKLTPTLLVLDPGQTLTADPTQLDDGTRPFIYTEALGTFTIDGQVYRGHSAFAIEVQYGLTEWYGDDVIPFDVINTRATVLLQGITIILDSQGLARYNSQLYGTTTPVVGQKPLKTIPAIGSYNCLFNRVNPYTGGISESAKFEVPSVKWDPNLVIPANPAGGPVEFPMAGEFRKLVGQPAWRVTTVTPNDVAYTT